MAVFLFGLTGFSENNNTCYLISKQESLLDKMAFQFSHASGEITNWYFVEEAKQEIAKKTPIWKQEQFNDVSKSKKGEVSIDNIRESIFTPQKALSVLQKYRMTSLTN